VWLLFTLELMLQQDFVKSLQPLERPSCLLTTIGILVWVHFAAALTIRLFQGCLIAASNIQRLPGVRCGQYALHHGCCGHGACLFCGHHSVALA
jgi:hypothetical protein